MTSGSSSGSWDIGRKPLLSYYIVCSIMPRGNNCLSYIYYVYTI